jgi:hypothetical protein
MRSASIVFTETRDVYGEVSYATRDVFGNLTTLDDAGGNTWTYQYYTDPFLGYTGLLSAVIPPSPDSGNPYELETTYNFDPNTGNLLSVTAPGGVDYSWIYDTAFNQLDEYIDPLGHKTWYAIDPVNGNTLSMTHVVGNDDRTASPAETDDITTAYTYTNSTDHATNGVPLGLLKTVTDPLLHVTHYYYNGASFGAPE